jgi:CheY-like chemotaxis protein
MTESAPIRVMLVDDHAVVRSGLVAFLAAFDDLELVAEAGTGEEAVRVCTEAQPNVVLMDLVMPGMDGAAATKAIRNKHPHIQVIALTSFKERDLVEGALQAGAIGYLLKNISADELADAIRAAHAGPRGGPGADPVGARAAVAGLRPDGAGTGGAGADGRRVEQPGDRRAHGGEPFDDQVPRQQRALQAGRCQPHRGGEPGAEAQAG